jgi:hypothetical protein
MRVTNCLKPVRVKFVCCQCGLEIEQGEHVFWKHERCRDTDGKVRVEFVTDNLEGV